MGGSTLCPKVKLHPEGPTPAAGAQDSPGPGKPKGILGVEEKEEEEEELWPPSRYQWVWHPYQSTLQHSTGGLPTHYRTQSACLFPRFPVLLLVSFLIHTLYVFLNHELANTLSGHLEYAHRRLTTLNVALVALCCLMFF